MRSVALGSQGLKVSRIGLGCMGMSQFYGEVPPLEQSRDTLLRAVDLGITLFDTADIYGAAAALYGKPGPGFGHNELLLGSVLGPHRDRVTVATRFGALVNAEGKVERNGRPGYVRAACEASLRRLGLERIGLWLYTRLDEKVSIEETIGAMADLVREGKVGFIGISEMPADILRRAHAVHPISALESEYSLWMRRHEGGVLEVCRELAVGFLAFSPLGRAMLTGTIRDNRSFVDTDFRRVQPKFQGENFERNRALVAELEAAALERGCTAGQLALAWLLHRGEHIVPIPGTKRAAYLEENVAAVDMQLSNEEVARLAAIFDPSRVAGEQYTSSYIGRA